MRWILTSGNDQVNRILNEGKKTIRPTTSSRNQEEITQNYFPSCPCKRDSEFLALVAKLFDAWRTWDTAISLAKSENGCQDRDSGRRGNEPTRWCKACSDENCDQVLCWSLNRQSTRNEQRDASATVLFRPSNFPVSCAFSTAYKIIVPY